MNKRMFKKNFLEEVDRIVRVIKFVTLVRISFGKSCGIWTICVIWFKMVFNYLAQVSIGFALYFKLLSFELDRRP